MVKRRPGAKQHRPLPELTDAQLEELVQRYWHSTEPRNAIEAAFGLHSTEFSKLVPRLPTGSACPHCGGTMAWRSRQARDRNEAGCNRCGHSTDHCNCPLCIEERDREEVRRQQQARSVWLDEYGGRDYVEWAVRQLSPPQRLFLDAIRKGWGGYLRWDLLAQSAGLQARWIEPALQRFKALGILFDDGAMWHLHPDLPSGRGILLPQG